MREVKIATASLCFGFALWLAGCATQWNSEEQLVLISSSPLDAKVTVDDRFILKTPGRVNLHRLGEHSILFEKEGYEPQVITTERVMSKWVFMDAVCILFWYYCIDRDQREGGWYRFQDEYHVTLNKRASADATPPPQASP